MVKIVEERPSIQKFSDEQFLECYRDGIVTENIIPVEKAKPEAGIFLDEDRCDALAGLRWDYDQSFAENQERLKSEIEAKLRSAS